MWVNFRRFYAALGDVWAVMLPYNYSKLGAAASSMKGDITYGNAVCLETVLNKHLPKRREVICKTTDVAGQDEETQQAQYVGSEQTVQSTKTEDSMMKQMIKNAEKDRVKRLQEDLAVKDKTIADLEAKIKNLAEVNSGLIRKNSGLRTEIQNLQKELADAHFLEVELENSELDRNELLSNLELAKDREKNQEIFHSDMCSRFNQLLTQYGTSLEQIRQTGLSSVENKIMCLTIMYNSADYAYSHGMSCLYQLKHIGESLGQDCSSLGKVHQEWTAHKVMLHTEKERCLDSLLEARIKLINQECLNSVDCTTYPSLAKIVQNVLAVIMRIVTDYCTVQQAKGNSHVMLPTFSSTPVSNLGAAVCRPQPLLSPFQNAVQMRGLPPFHRQQLKSQCMWQHCSELSSPAVLKPSYIVPGNNEISLMYTQLPEPLPVKIPFKSNTVLTSEDESAAHTVGDVQSESDDSNNSSGNTFGPSSFEVQLKHLQLHYPMKTLYELYNILEVIRATHNNKEPYVLLGDELTQKVEEIEKKMQKLGIKSAGYHMNMFLESKNSISSSTDNSSPPKQQDKITK